MYVHIVFILCHFSEREMTYDCVIVAITESRFKLLVVSNRLMVGVKGGGGGRASGVESAL